MNKFLALLGFVSLSSKTSLGGTGCKYVYTGDDVSNFAALGVCADYSYVETIGNNVDVSIDGSYMYKCNSAETKVNLLTWDDTGCNGNATVTTEYTDDSDRFNCGDLDCSVKPRLTQSDTSGSCDSDDLGDTYFEAPILTGYCLYYSSIDSYSEEYTCSDNALIFKEYNTTQMCDDEPSYEYNFYEACVTVTVSVSSYSESGTWLFTVDDCNNAFGLCNNNMNHLFTLLFALIIGVMYW